MSAAKATRQPTAPAPDMDETSRRLLAYLASMRPLRGVADVYGDDPYQRGRALIEQMAMMVTGTDYPPATLSPSDCADVLRFVHFSEPIDPRRWWDDPKHGPSHVVGFNIVLVVLEQSLRKARAKGAKP
jgi:hypothetical protein